MTTAEKHPTEPRKQAQIPLFKDLNPEPNPYFKYKGAAHENGNQRQEKKSVQS